VAVTADGDEAPALILDAGTGIRSVTGLLAGQPYAGHILLSHLHWDHVHGLPFFRAGDTPGARTSRAEIRVWSVLTVDVVDGRIQTVRVVRNPDKLAHL